MGESQSGYVIMSAWMPLNEGGGRLDTGLTPDSAPEARVMNSVNSRDQLVFYSAKTLSRVKYLIFCGHAELKGGRCTKTKCWGGFRFRGCCCGAFISEFTRRQRTIRV